MSGGEEEANRTAWEEEPVLRDFLRGIEPIRGKIRRVILFGSRARGEARFDSDYDVLVVVPARDREIMDVLYESVMDVLLAHGQLVSLKVFPEVEYNRLTALKTPFMSSVAKEGRAIG